MSNLKNKVAAVFAASGAIAGAVDHVAETAAFLVSDYGVTFNSHIVDADGGKFNVI